MFRRVPALQRQSASSDQHSRQSQAPGPLDGNHIRTWSWPSVWQRISAIPSKLNVLPTLRLYFSHPAVIPSFSLSLVYLTVLSFSGQMLTYLLAANFTMWQVGIMRGGSTIFELSATWIAPRLMKHVGVLRTGLWSISWQMTCLAAGVTWFFYYYGRGYLSTDIMPAAGLAVAVAFSRVGLWGFDLSVQNIVQDVRRTFLVPVASSSKLILV